MSIRNRVSNHITPNRPSLGIDQYDHAITLIDTTRPASPVQDESSNRESEAEHEVASDIPAEEIVPVTRIFSKSAINQKYNQTRYARFQEPKYSRGQESDGDKRQGRTRTVIKSLDNKRGRALERLHLRARKAGKAKDLETAVDILYENQRGLFIFGYPLYSSRSLLNFDPSAWTNAEFQDSAVDIRNAQVPDPTWTWAWNRWYVDMSGDVDEQGWQYSLMFGKRFTWHGTHPWFHSAVRRRRWLRKRVKLQHPHHKSDAHDMAQDYFTIHSAKRERSRGSSIASKTLDKSSRLSGRIDVSEISEDEDDIDNVITLLHVMKNTTVDRKKLDAFRNFIKHGGEELQLLPEILPELWKLLLYQNSTRELLHILEEAEHDLEKDDKTESEGSTSKTVSDLRSTINRIRENLSQVEYYSDAKAMAKVIDEHSAGHVDADQVGDINEQQRLLDNVEPSKEPSKDINIETTRVSFQGIPKSAGLDINPGIARPESSGNTGNTSGRK